MRKTVLILFLIVFSVQLDGQTLNVLLSGKVSFVSSQNIYVKFSSTEGISTGDTLYNVLTSGKLTPALKVTNLSSTSCVCTAISSDKFSPNDQVSAIMKKNTVVPVTKISQYALKDSSIYKLPVTEPKKNYEPGVVKKKVRGSISAYSYSSSSNTPAPNSTRLRYNLNLDAKNIGNSKFSFETYISFNHKPGDWAPLKSDIFNALKIYSLSVKYDLNKTTQISVGRRINPKIASIGAMDGIQVEKSFNKFSLGVLAGSRPKFTDYGIDTKLFQYGAYMAYSSITSASYNESSLAFMQQTNNGSTDRRFLYFQHTNSLIKNLYFMGTFEVDLYKLKSDSLKNYTSQNTFDLTGLYLSLRYRISKKLSLTGSYDERKNVMYYETYKSFMDRLLESEMRQSFRLQTDLRITNKLAIGVQSGYRSLKSDPHPTRNIYGYLSYSQIPGINSTLTLSGTYLESNYLNSKVYGALLSHDFFQGKFYTSVGYHYMDYTYPESLLNTVQNIAEFNLSWQFAKGISFSTNYEGTFEKKNTYHRVYLQIRKRF